MTDGDDLRIGTAERESAVKILTDHMSEGRLTLEEYDERVAAALEARTRADLRTLFTDLPPPYPYPSFVALPALPPPTTAPALHLPPPPPAGYSERYRVVAGVLNIVFPFGVGRFYTGHTNIAVAQLLLCLVGVGVIWSIVDGAILLGKGGTDVNGRELRS
jgi:hypothetical protein